MITNTKYIVPDNIILSSTTDDKMMFVDISNDNNSVYSLNKIAAEAMHLLHEAKDKAELLETLTQHHQQLKQNEISIFLDLFIEQMLKKKLIVEFTK